MTFPALARPAGEWSPAERLAMLPAAEQETWLRAQSPATLAAIKRGEWWFRRRPKQVEPPGDWLVWAIGSGRGWGKALALDTPIATPSGWATMETLRVGDSVFDEQGRPCTVTATFDVGNPDSAYRVSFSDGTHIDACSEHLWVTWTHRDRKQLNRQPDRSGLFPPNWAAKAPLTTAELAATDVHGKRGDLNHCIPITAPLELPEAPLPVAPYTLGAWLGDGGSHAAVIYCADEAIIEAVRADGYPTCRIRDTTPGLPTYRVGSTPLVRDSAGRMMGNGSLHTVLRLNGLIGNKHIPAEYLRASYNQRLALLQGLMDTDGTADIGGSKAELTFTNRRLAFGALELVRSLGQKPVVKESDAKLNGRVISRRWRITWRPTIDVFRLERKRQRIRPPLGSQGFRNRHRMITAVQEIPAQPMRCITVDSPNSMYLAGESMIPTHNTQTGAETLTGWVEQSPHDRHGNRTEWMVIAEKVADLISQNVEGASGLLNVLIRRGYKQVPRKPKGDLPAFTYVKAPKPKIIVYPHGQVIHCESFESGGADVGRGYNLAGLWMDELAKWGPKARDAWYDGLLPALRTDLPEPHHPRCICTTTPKPIGLLREWWERARLGDPSYRLTIGSTYENASNLNPYALNLLIRELEGTRKGRQELHGELLDEIDGALWSRDLLEACRVTRHPELIRIAIGMDPAGTGEGAEQGLVVVGQDALMEQYVIGDHSRKIAGAAGAELAWKVVAEYRHLLPRHRTPILVVEEDYGKKWLKDVLEISYKDMQAKGVFGAHDPMPIEYAKASLLGGKDLRAEPIVMRYETHRFHHVGVWAELERQQCTWDRKDPKAPSPDRVDGLVHAGLYLRDQEPHMSQTSNWADNLTLPVTSLEYGAGM